MAFIQYPLALADIRKGDLLIAHFAKIPSATTIDLEGEARSGCDCGGIGMDEIGTTRTVG